MNSTQGWGEHMRKIKQTLCRYYKSDDLVLSQSFKS